MNNSPSPDHVTAWFIGTGVVAAAVLAWFGSGQPGLPLQDGDYGCVEDAIAQNGPGATVSGGEVVDVWAFNIEERERTPLMFHSPERQSRTKFLVLSQTPMAKERMATFTCTL